MDIKAQEGTDDAELANMLASNSTTPTDTSTGLQFEESPLPAPADSSSTMPVDASTATDAPAPQDAGLTAPTDQPAPAVEQPAPFTPVAPVSDPAATAQAGNPELENIRQEALNNLRPLVDKLELPPEEHFDTLLLVIRSTDDQSLLSQAFTAAKAIPDDTRRAQALLDIIKEIDFFNSQPK